MDAKQVVVYLDEASSLKYNQDVDCRFPNVSIVAVINNKAYRADSFGYPRTIKFNKDFFYGLPKPGLFSKNKPINLKLYYFNQIEKKYTLDVVFAKDRKTGKSLGHIGLQGIKLSIYVNNFAGFEKFLRDMKVSVKPGILFTEADLSTLVSSLASFIAGDLINAGYLSSSDFDSRGFCSIYSRKDLMKVDYKTASRKNKFRDELLSRMESSLNNMGFYLSKTVN